MARRPADALGDFMYLAVSRLGHNDTTSSAKSVWLMTGAVLRPQGCMSRGSAGLGRCQLGGPAVGRRLPGLGSGYGLGLGLQHVCSP